MIFLAYIEGCAVRLAACFRGFSTFAALPLINIAHLAVLPELRGNGIGSALLAAIEQKVRALGCCKVTLKVQENNFIARRVYENADFEQAVYGETTGGSLLLDNLCVILAVGCGREPTAQSSLPVTIR